jgi:hypothetical protein
MSEISLYIDSHLVGKRAKRIFSRRMWMVFGFWLNHASESSAKEKYTIYLPSFLAAIHYYVAFPLVDILFITKEPLLIPTVSRNAYLSGKVPLWIYTLFLSYANTGAAPKYRFIYNQNCVLGEHSWNFRFRIHIKIIFRTIIVKEYFHVLK